MSITGEPDGPPCKVGVAVTDISTGLYAHGSILAALLSRQQTGKGVWIDVNLFETQVSGSQARTISPRSNVCTALVSTLDCWSRECGLKLPHWWCRRLEAWHSTSFNRAVSSLPLQGWVHHDWSWQ